MTERLSRATAARILRAKVQELETSVLANVNEDGLSDFGYLTADVALIAAVLADELERQDTSGH